MEESRFGLYIIPAIISAAVQIAGQPDAVSTFGLPVGQASAAILQLSRFLIANITKKNPAPTPPTWSQWRPFLSFQFVSHDLPHYVYNHLAVAQSISAMKFPTRFMRGDDDNPPQQRSARGVFRSFLRFIHRLTFLGTLMLTGSAAGALTMEAASGRGLVDAAAIVRRSVAVAEVACAKASLPPPTQMCDTLALQVSDIVEPILRAVFPSRYYNGDDDSLLDVACDRDFAACINRLLGLGAENNPIQVILVGFSGAAFALDGYNLGFDFSASNVISSIIMFGASYLEDTRRATSVSTAHYAHIGGFVWGVTVGWICRKIEDGRRHNRRHNRLAFS